MAKRFWNREIGKEMCFPAIFGFEICQIFRLHVATVTKNRASFAAGVFSLYASGVSISCGPGHEAVLPSKDHEMMRQPDALAAYCLNVTGNVVSDGEDIADAATGVVSLAIEGWNATEPLINLESGQNIDLPCESAKTNTSCKRHPLRVAVKDIFGHTIVRGIDDANLTLILESENIVGELRYTAKNGIAEINSTRAKHPNVTSKPLTIRSERYPDINITIYFSTRECYPGEIETDLSCQSCVADQYSFHPEKKSCRPCETDAICKGGAALVPKDGFWHSTPFSPVFRKCVSNKACKYAKRQDILGEFYDDDQKMKELREELDGLSIRENTDGTMPRNFSEMYHQCHEGYRGYLCGSCAPGYGRAYNGDCQECPNVVSHYGLSILLTIGWRFMLIGLNCAVTLMSMNSRIDLVRHEQEESGRGNTPRILRNQHSRKAIVVESPRSSRIRGHIKRISLIRWQDVAFQVDLAQRILIMTPVADLLFRNNWLPRLN